MNRRVNTHKPAAHSRQHADKTPHQTGRLPALYGKLPVWRVGAGRAFGAALAAVALIGSLCAQAQTTTLDKVIAIVDDDVVMASELEQQLAIISTRIQAQQTQLPPEDVLRSQVLEKLIVDRLQLQMADRAGVRIEDGQINQAIARMQQANNLTAEAFAEELRREGMTPSTLREQVRREMVINQVQQGRVNRRIQITEQEIDNFLNSTEGKFWTSPDYQLGHMLIAVATGAGEEEKNAAREKAEQLFQQLQQGADFKQLAIANSAGPQALQGGDLGWRKTAQLPALFAEVVPGLKPGQTSAPFASDAGFHLLKLYDQRGGGERMVEQAKVRHILIKPSTILSDDEAREKLLDIRRQIVAGGSFEALCKEHSEDIGSMLSGGDLGWSTPGQFVPAFEETMKQTAVGEISEPFRSQFGWHILKVDERRNQDMTETVIRNQARNLLRKRRFEEELQTWLREIRDEAYVEIKG
ncbi:molecular chaperone SurA [Exilibacterium tricleocarpae]|uniref:Chaperone SurA n=1 Tax=Exilibacterium tricleocarpae TaxID=2591008 RepID=A0A545T3J5_9GAMM|nr:peptidylprolyl isomerase [Exilibacterium tricleocarpae]TQV71787.1 molecular chaperone SurA [Exilibacterium tricleocarpae]